MSDLRPTPPHTEPKWTGFASALFAIGLLILIPSGLCTSIFGLGALYDAVTGSGSDALEFLVEALVVGLPFIAIGVGLVMAGRSISRRGKT